MVYISWADINNSDWKHFRCPNLSASGHAQLWLVRLLLGDNKVNRSINFQPGKLQTILNHWHNLRCGQRFCGLLQKSANTIIKADPYGWRFRIGMCMWSGRWITRQIEAFFLIDQYWLCKAPSSPNLLFIAAHWAVKKTSFWHEAVRVNKSQSDTNKTTIASSLNEWYPLGTVAMNWDCLNSVWTFVLQQIHTDTPLSTHFTECLPHNRNVHHSKPSRHTHFLSQHYRKL